MAAEPLVLLTIEDDVARITLNHARRHNSLNPELLGELNGALAEVAARPLTALVLAANGRSFSTGGDVAAFSAEPRGARREYAHALVGALSQVILTLLDLPFPVIARVQGPVTGGSAGMVFASDLVAMADDAFIAPYYVDVGFAPDGGWTVLLPERIGAARAGAVQLLNSRITATDAFALGIATHIGSREEFDAQIDHWLSVLKSKVPSSIRATRQLLFSSERRAAVAAGLERERARFVAEIETPAVETGMQRFLEGLR